jgi:hypothetical protein
MTNALTLKHLLKSTLPSPSYELSPIVGENLTRRTPLANSATHHFQYRLCRLLTEQSVSHKIPRVVVDDTDQIHPVHSLELEREDVDLPQCIGQRPLKTTHLRRPTLWLRRSLSQPGVVDDSPHCFGAYRHPIVASELVTDAPHALIGVRLAMLYNPTGERLTYLPGRPRAGVPRQTLQSLFAMRPPPVVDACHRHARKLRHLPRRQSLLGGLHREKLHLQRYLLATACHRA